MTKNAIKNETEKTSGAVLAAAYLDRWEKNLILFATKTPPIKKGGSERA